MDGSTEHRGRWHRRRQTGKMGRGVNLVVGEGREESAPYSRGVAIRSGVRTLLRRVISGWLTRKERVCCRVVFLRDFLQVEGRRRKRKRCCVVFFFWFLVWEYNRKDEEAPRAREVVLTCLTEVSERNGRGSLCERFWSC